MAVVSGIFTMMAVSLRHDRVVKETPVIIRSNSTHHDQVETGDHDKDRPLQRVETVETV